ncbi:MAG: hypothetical protein GEU91_05875 [Rhizobiales bacterium]|nr:hypothetical protein [Hyphomicrobiales bacterium]
MIKSKTSLASSLSALAIAGAIAAIHAQPAAAQTATNLQCDGCVNSRDIQNGSIRAADLVPGLAFGRTVLVQSNGANNTANCNRLRNALAQIDDASVKNPVLVKLERGTYNCGSTPLAMKPFVTIEGAGRSFTRIFGNTAAFDQGVITGANESALRHLTVEHAASGSGTAIAINSLGRRVSLTDVAIKIDSATANSVFGILAPGGVLGLTNVSVQTNNPGGGGQGISAASGAKLDMMNVWVHNFSGAGNPAALVLSDSSATGFGILFSSNTFGLLGVGNSVFELVGGTLIGGAVGAGGFTGSFSCVGIADGADFTARAADCS